MFTVRVADHETEPARTSWRIKHAADTISIVHAYFGCDLDGRPIQADDGSFEVHWPGPRASSVIDTLRAMLGHEGLIIVREEDAPGNGLIVAVDRATGRASGRRAFS